MASWVLLTHSCQSHSTWSGVFSFGAQHHKLSQIESFPHRSEWKKNIRIHYSNREGYIFPFSQLAGHQLPPESSAWGCVRCEPGVGVAIELQTPSYGWSKTTAFDLCEVCLSFSRGLSACPNEGSRYELLFRKVDFGESRYADRLKFRRSPSLLPRLSGLTLCGGISRGMGDSDF